MTFQNWKQCIQEFRQPLSSEEFIFDLFENHKNFMISPVQIIDGKQYVAKSAVFESLDDIKQFVEDDLYVYMCIKRFAYIDGEVRSKFLLRFAGVNMNGSGMTFSQALVLLKSGKKVARSGWNDKNMFIFLVNGSQFVVNREPLMSILGEGTEVTYNPHIDMKAADGTIFPWSPNQLDIMANDWEIVR